jgi:hypothetical protein
MVLVQSACGFALPGVVTIPRHTRARRVTSVLRAELAEVFTGITAEIVEGLPEGPDEAVRSAGRWMMPAEAIGSGLAVGYAKGADAYGTTAVIAVIAVIAVEGAHRLIVDGGEAGRSGSIPGVRPRRFPRQPGLARDDLVGSVMTQAGSQHHVGFPLDRQIQSGTGPGIPAQSTCSDRALSPERIQETRPC